MPRRKTRAPLFAGVDVGGSSIKLGVLARDGTRREERSIPVQPGDSAEELFRQAASSLLELAEDAPLGGVGAGLPGLLDRTAGWVRQSPNLPWLVEVPVAELLARHLPVDAARIVLENDANVAALGEQWLGAAAGERDLLLMTLGTGIGGGLILRGELYVGEGGLAGEVGHVTIDPNGAPCGCGSRGCLETLASASAARRRALERKLPAEAPGDLELLTRIARAGPGPERDLLEAVGYDLGCGIAEVLDLLDLRTYLFGGGFSAALDVLEPGIRRGLRAWSYGERLDRIRLIRASLGGSAGWIGAARVGLG